MKAKCIFCGAPADLLCDSHLGWERMRGQMEKEAPNLVGIRHECVPMRYRLVHTCDAPLCRACAVSGGTVHAHLRSGTSIHESIDYCPGHGFGTMRRELTGLEAEAIRAEWRARARRQRETSVMAEGQPDMFGGEA